MNATAETRSNAKAGNVQAGDTMRSAQPVGALLAEVSTVADADQLRPILERRLAAAEASVTEHGAPDPLWEDDRHSAHAEEHARRQRDVDRCRVALDRLGELRAQLVVAEVQAAARARIAGPGAAAAERAEARVTRYRKLALELGELLAAQDSDEAEIKAARLQAQEAGIGDEASHLLTPAERRFRPAIFSMVEEVVDRGGAPRVLDAEGRELNGRGGRDFSADQRPAPETRRVERMTSPPMRAPDLTRIRVVLPSPEAGAAPLVDRRGDA